MDIPPEPETQDPILTYEEFIQPFPSGVPRWNNLILFFKGDQNKIDTKYFKELVEKDPALVLRIILFFQRLQFIPRQGKSFAPIELDLYRAYCFMRSVGASNQDLFR